MFMLQSLERVFPKAEALKKRLTERYTVEENKRLAEMVSSMVFLSINVQEFFYI